jgi:hypothetical protein
MGWGAIALGFIWEDGAELAEQPVSISKNNNIGILQLNIWFTSFIVWGGLL